MTHAPTNDIDTSVPPKMTGGRVQKRDDLLVLHAGDTQMIVDTSMGVPHIVHLGHDLDILSSSGGSSDLVSLLQSPRGPATLDALARASVCPEAAAGWMGRPGLRGHRPDGSASAPLFEPQAVVAAPTTATVTATDPVAGLTLITTFETMPASIRIRLELRNESMSAYQLEELTATVPIPARANELMRLAGRWSHEFQPRRHAWTDGALSFDNRRGRTSHDRVGCLFAGETAFTENAGDVWGFVIGWSGSTIASAEVLTDGQRVIQMGALLASGDVSIEPGDSYQSPWVECVASQRGLNGVSQALHASIRSRPGHPTIERPRPVTLSTWEALYFDQDFDKLRDLASRAAEVGCERFVLDDGWFHDRRDDSAGGGDWWVDPVVWPDGLEPLIQHATKLGLEFGIWVEPEMMSRDSDLYRSHPEWALADDPHEAILGRHQLVLNLGRPDVIAYLFEKLNSLLADHEVAFVKWDMNRDLAAVSHARVASIEAHLRGVYALWDALRDAHPEVEFESCASGGGRADFEILKRAERIWTSDSNDALERQIIQKGFSMLFPPEVMGAHIGPPTSHTTGRTHSLGFRASTAFFGHLGIEWNLLAATDKELAQLADVVSAHKRFRPLLHGGTTWRLDIDDPSAVAHMVVGADRTEALLSYCQLRVSESSIPPKIRLTGLDPEQRYMVEVVPFGDPPGALTEVQVAWLKDGITASGRLLETIGLQAPILHPETAIVICLRSAS